MSSGKQQPFCPDRNVLKGLLSCPFYIVEHVCNTTHKDSEITKPCRAGLQIFAAKKFGYLKLTFEIKEALLCGKYLQQISNFDHTRH